MEALSFPARRGIQGFFLFILLFGEKNEPRRTAARYRAFSFARRRLARGLRNSLRSHSPRPFSALGCRPPGPIRAVSPFPYLHVFACFPFFLLLPFRLKGEGTVILRLTGNPRFDIRRWYFSPRRAG